MDNQITQEKKLQTGFARLTITPPLGINIPGYYETRISDGVLDDLHVTAIAFSDGEKKAVLFSVDAIGIRAEVYEILKKMIAERCGIDEDAIYITCTHSHTAFRFMKPAEPPKSTFDIYMNWLFFKMCDCAQFAFEDLLPTEIRIGRETAPGIAFIRRYMMKDGTVRTNPMIGDPNIDHMMDKQDDDVYLLRMIREGGKEILLVNFGTHADVIGGKKYSADFGGVVVRTLEGAFRDNVSVIYVNGAEGDSNHLNPFLPKGSPRKGMNLAENMGRTIAGAVLKCYQNATPVFCDKIDYCSSTVEVGKNSYDEDEVPICREVAKIHAQNPKDPALKEFPIGVPRALRILNNLKKEGNFHLHLSALQIGNIVFSGIPGEPFVEIGLKIKENSPFDLTIVTSCTNGSQGYYPTASAYEVGGYEKNASPFAENCAQVLIDGSLELLSKLEVKKD